MEERAHARPPARILDHGQVLALLEKLRRPSRSEGGQTNPQPVEVESIQGDGQQSSHLSEARKDEAEIVQALAEPRKPVDGRPVIEICCLMPARQFLGATMTSTAIGALVTNERHD